MTKLYLMYIYIYGYSSISSPTCRCSCVDYVRYTSKAKERKKESKSSCDDIYIQFCYWNMLLKEKEYCRDIHTYLANSLRTDKTEILSKKTKNRFWLFIVHLNASERNDSYTICGNKHGKILPDIYIHTYFTYFI